LIPKCVDVGNRFRTLADLCRDTGEPSILAR